VAWRVAARLEPVPAAALRELRDRGQDGAEGAGDARLLGDEAPPPAVNCATRGWTAAAELAPLGIAVTLGQPGPTATAFLANLDLAEPIDDYDQTVRAVQKAIGELGPDAFSSPAQIAQGILAAVDAEQPPLRLAVGASGAHDMPAALQARLRDLDEWAPVAAAA